MSLGRIGSKKLTNYTTDSSTEAEACRLHFWHTVNFLLESFDWPFARARSELTASETTPDFQWGYQYALPDDFLCLRHNYTESESEYVDCRWEIEGTYLMTDDSEVDLKYTKKITDTTLFPPLFIEVLVLQLAYKLIPMVAGTEARTLTETIERELVAKTAKARTKYLQESNTSGRSDWHWARYGSRTK